MTDRLCRIVRIDKVAPKRNVVKDLLRSCDTGADVQEVLADQRISCYPLVAKESLVFG